MVDSSPTAVMLVTKQFGTNGTFQRLKFMDIISQSAFVFIYFFTKVDTHTVPHPQDHPFVTTFAVYQPVYSRSYITLSNTDYTV